MKDKIEDAQRAAKTMGEALPIADPRSPCERTRIRARTMIELNRRASLLMLEMMGALSELPLVDGLTPDEKQKRSDKLAMLREIFNDWDEERVDALNE